MPVNSYFYAAIKHDKIDEVINILEKYINESTRYIITCETAKYSHIETEGQHMHFAVEDFDKKYDNFRNNVLKKKFGLRGKVNDGKPKQYGKTDKNKIRDEDKYLCYMCKEANIENIYYKNYDLKTIQDYIARSYPKEESKSAYQEALISYLDDNKHTFTRDTGTDIEYRYIPSIHTDALEEMILKHYIQEVDKVLTINQLRYYVNKYLQSKTKDYTLMLLYMKNKNI
jgi:hypothetical protein